jgi:DNA polymerase III sliding clamp (beta) subunit (PCNA family)
MKKIVVKRSELITGLQRVEFCAVSKEKHPNLPPVIRACYFNGRIEMVAMDGHRLSIVRIPVKTEELSSQGLNFMADKMLVAQIKLFDGEDVAITRKKDTLVFRALKEKGVFEVPLHKDGASYPYERIIPKSYNTVALINKDTLYPLVKTIKDTVVLDFSNSLRIEQIRNGDTYVFGIVPYEREGEEAIVHFDQRYLRQALSCVKKPTIKISINGEWRPSPVIRPVKIQGVGEEGLWEHYLMPIKPV